MLRFAGMLTTGPRRATTMRLCWTAIAQMDEQGIYLKQVQYILICKKIVTDVGDYNSHATIPISALT